MERWAGSKACCTTPARSSRSVDQVVHQGYRLRFTAARIGQDPARQVRQREREEHAVQWPLPRAGQARSAVPKSPCAFSGTLSARTGYRYDISAMPAEFSLAQARGDIALTGHRARRRPAPALRSFRPSPRPELSRIPVVQPADCCPQLLKRRNTPKPESPKMGEDIPSAPGQDQTQAARGPAKPPTILAEGASNDISNHTS
jgi:hypothetical protein